MGPFKSYVGRNGYLGGKSKMSLPIRLMIFYFLLHMSIQEVGSHKNSKNLSTYLLNDPMSKPISKV